jgi:plasmid replication initiation protein
MDRYLIKHSAAIHITNKISMLERKIFNICLKNAYADLKSEQKFQLSLSSIKKELGWSENSHDNEQLKDSLRNLVSTVVEWNTFGKDKSKEWGVCSLLSSVKIRSGTVTYTYGDEIRGYLSSPNIYAKLNMAIQRDITSKHALALWEFLNDALATFKGQSHGVQMPLTEIKTLFGIDENSSYSEFKRINEKILKPACEELNKISDISVRMEFIRQNKKVTEVLFHISKKMSALEKKRDQEPVFVDINTPKTRVLEMARKAGISISIIEKMFSHYKEEEWIAAISCLTQIGEKREIKNKDAYLITLLKNGINDKDRDIVLQPSLDEAADALISKFAENMIYAKDICRKIGMANFISWFKNVQMTERENTINLIFKDAFARDSVETKFNADISMALGTEKKVKFILLSEC